MPPSPAHASTVVLMRDFPDGIEVYLVEKARNLEFAGGAFVFPGGTVRKEDCSREWLSYFPQAPIETIRAAFPDSSEGECIGFFVAAIRELFEEAGILLARNSLSEKTKEEIRLQLQSGMDFLEIAKQFKLLLLIDKLTYFSHWITPEVYPIRFSARFFLAEFSADQNPSPDGRETQSDLWISPSLAMEEHSAGKLPLMTPTLITLQELSHFQTAKDALAWGERRTKIPRRPWVDEKGIIHLA